MFLHELRHAWRQLTTRPGYALLSASVLGVGLGVVLFLFSLVNSLMLEPLPFPDAARLMSIGEATASGNGIDDLDSDEYLNLRGRLRGIDDIGAYTHAGVSLDAGAGATWYPGAQLTASMMHLVGIRPILGRTFAEADDKPGAARVVMMDEAIWRNDFKADPHIIGRAVRANGEWATVVGILPVDFGFPGASRLWLPLRLETGRHDEISAVAKLKMSTGLEQARQELDPLAGRLQRELPEWRNGQRLTMKPMALSFVPEDMRRWVWLMFAAGTLVLLLACVNVANLQLVQTLNRRRELAVRSALGGTRWHLMGGVLAESLILSVGALAIALPIVQLGNRWIVSTYISHQQPDTFRHFGIDGRVLVFAAFAALLSTAVAGLVPAWRASRTDLQDALRDGGKGSGGGFVRVAKALVVVEIALTVVLLMGAGTFIRALDGLMTMPIAGGTHAQHILTADIALPPGGYANADQRIDFFETIAERLRREPGVIDATIANTVPGAALGSHEYVSARGQPRPADGWPRAELGIVDQFFLQTYDVHLSEGRFFTDKDDADSPAVTVIDRKAAAALWPGRDPIGQTLLMHPGQPWERTLTVVGVIEPLRMDELQEKPLPGVLMPLRQAMTQEPLKAIGVAVHTRTDGAAFAARLTAIVRGVDTQAAVHGLRNQSQAMAMGRVGLMVLTEVFTALGLVALLLAAAGLYGVLAFSVTQRTREIGIRRAIGASHARILRAAGRQLAWQLGLGLGIGMALAWPWSRILADPNLHTGDYDAAVFVPVLAVVVLMTIVASLVPLVRALRVDPAVALRYE
jgi:predicted permease